MINSFISTLAYSALAGLATFFSAYFILNKKNIREKHLIYFVSFSAGLLFSLAFLHIIPESLELSPKNAYFAIILSFFVFYALEQRIMMHSCAEEKCEHHHLEKKKGLVGLWGIMLHSLIDGALIGIGFEVSFVLGLATALAVLVHKIPDGISVSTILIKGGFNKSRALRGILMVSLATPIGAIFALLLLQNVSADTIGLALGLSGGTLLYISASDLIPETHEKFNSYNVFFVGLGVLAIVVLKFLL